MQLRRLFPIFMVMLLLSACQGTTPATLEPTTPSTEPTAAATIEVVPTAETFDADTGDGERSAEISAKEGEVSWRLALEAEWSPADIGQGLATGRSHFTSI